ncbi:MAG: hypothetical protein F4X59_17265 [Holophagales bacterium]|nr:hypothetical protein [Holophagales bacterium]
MSAPQRPVPLVPAGQPPQPAAAEQTGGASAPGGLQVSGHEPGWPLIVAPFGACGNRPPGSLRQEAKRLARTMSLLDADVNGGGRWVVLTFERLEEWDGG